MFDSIAPGYDAFNHLTSLGADRRWRRLALREIVGARVLDEACGTGDFSLSIARHLAKQHNGSRKGVEKSREELHGSWSVVGVDISEGMLDVMRKKVDAAMLTGAVDAPAASTSPVSSSEGERQACGISQPADKAACKLASEQAGGELPARISAELGDCCALRFTDASFDSVTVAFGVRNFEDREKALAEVLRVLRPGGRFVMLELGIPRNRFVRACYKFYFTRIMPLIGAGISGDRAAYRYLPASVLNFPTPEEWLATMRAAGFAIVRHRSLSLGICNLFVGEK